MFVYNFPYFLTEEYMFDQKRHPKRDASHALRSAFSELNRQKPISVYRKKVVNVVIQTASVCPPPVVSFATVPVNHEKTMKHHIAPK